MGLGAELRRAVRSRGFVVIAAISAALAVGIPIMISAVLLSPDRHLDVIVGPAQLIVSVPVPFLGVLVVRDLQVERPTRDQLITGWALATILALVFGAITLIIGAVAVAVVPHRDSAFQNVAVIIIGGLLTQVVAQSTGTGFGLLIRRVPVAMLATVLPPLVLFWLFGTIPGLDWVQRWLTPLGASQHLAFGAMSPMRWAAASVVFAVWGLGLNVVGVLRIRRQSDSHTDRRQVGG